MEPTDIQGRVGTLLDSVEDEFLRNAIGELFTMDKLKWGVGDVTCKDCGAIHRYKLEISSPDYKGIAYALKTLLDAIGRTKEPPKEEGVSPAVLEAIREEIRAAVQGEPVPS